MFLRPSRSLRARIRALLGNRSFASSHEDIGPRGQVVPVLNRIRRMTLHRGISFLATRTAHPFVVAQRVIVKVYHPNVSRVVLHSCVRDSCVTVFNEEKTLQTFPLAVSLGILPPENLCVVSRVSFVRNENLLHSPSFCRLAERTTKTPLGSRKANRGFYCCCFLS